MNAAVPVLHYCLPGHEIARAVPLVGERIGAFLERTGWAERRKLNGRWRYCFRLPTACLVNGEYVLQRQWRRRRIALNDQVAFVSRPLGGGGGGGGGRGGNTKAVLGIVALIAVAAFAFWAGPLIAGAFGLSATFGTLFTSAIILGGSLLINALVTPKTGGQNPAQNEDVPQVFSLQAAGNLARPLQTIPCRYGRLKRFLDYATQPWSEYIGDEQYLNIILSEGVGRFQKHQILIDDTLLWDQSSGLQPGYAAQIEFIEPGGTVTLFPADVVTATEVNGQTLPSGTGYAGSGSGVGGGGSATPGAFVGGFIVNAAGTLANHLAADFVFPGGVFRVDSNGKIQLHSITVEVEARPVNASGVPIGSFTQLIFQNFTFSERKPKRVTLKAAVSPGRYEVRARRWGAELPSGGIEGADSVVWVAARAFLVGDNAFPGVSTVAIRIRATEITQGAAQRFNVISTRMLPVWTGAEFQIGPTRNPAWAFWDMATNQEYGAKRPLAKVDFNAVVNTAIGCDTRGDHFDFDFTNGVPAPDAFDTILRTTRSRHCWSGDILSITRDELKTVPQMLLTDREISRGSLQVGYAFLAEDDADCVILEYLDETIWAPADVQWPAPDIVAAENPARLRIDGVVERAKAQEHAAFFWRQNVHRRTTATLDTEWDGKMLAFGSYVRVQSELPQTWGACGRIVRRSGLNLTLDPGPSWPSGQNYIEVRTARGKRWGPVKCFRGTSDINCVLDSADLAAVEAAQGPLNNALARMPGAEEASFALGLASQRAMDCIVLRGQPTGDRVTLNLVVDNALVHDDDIPNPADLPDRPPLSDEDAPIVAGLTARFDTGQIEPTLRASWYPSKGAQYYVAQVSYDGGASYGQIYQGTQSMFSAVVDYRSLNLRVQAIGRRPGPWAVIGVTDATDPRQIHSEKIELNGVVFENVLAGTATNLAWATLTGGGANHSGGFNDHGFVTQASTSGLVAVMIEINFFRISSGGAGGVLNVAIFIDGIQGKTFQLASSVAQGIPLTMRQIVAVSPVAHNYSARVQLTVAGQYTFVEGTITVEELRK